MLIGDIKKAIRFRCNFSPILTPEFIRISALQVISDISLKAKGLKTTHDIMLTPDTFFYDIPIETMMINKIEYGTPKEFAENLQSTLVPGADYNLIWTGSGGPQTAQLKINFTTDSNKVLKIYQNIFSDASAILDLADNMDTSNLNNVVAPICEQAIIDGVVHYYKLDFERNPTSSASIEKYVDTLEALLNHFNERIEHL